MGGRGSGGAGGGGARGSSGGGGKSNSSGGAKYMSSEDRAKMVADVERDVAKMKAPTLGKSSTVESNGLTGVVTKERNAGRGGGTFYDVAVWSGNEKIYNVARSNWAQAKDALRVRMPSMAVAKAEGRSY